MADRKTKQPAAPAKTQRTAGPDRKRATGVRVSYQGEPGANSHLACNEVFPDCVPFAVRDLRGCTGCREER